MPCQDDGYHADTEKELLKKRVDELTQNLCYLCGELIAAGAPLEECASERIRTWWTAHCEADRARVYPQMLGRFQKDPDLEPAVLSGEFILAAERVHPVSRYHRRWFKDLAAEAQRFVLTVREEDRRRNEAREQVLGKLTDEELAALGIKR